MVGAVTMSVTVRRNLRVEGASHCSMYPTPSAKIHLPDDGTLRPTSSDPQRLPTRRWGDHALAVTSHRREIARYVNLVDLILAPLANPGSNRAVAHCFYSTAAENREDERETTHGRFTGVLVRDGGRLILQRKVQA